MISRAALAPEEPVRRWDACGAAKKRRGWGFVTRPIQNGTHGEELIEWSSP